MSDSTASENTDRLIRANVELSRKKSSGISLALTLFFGPFGLFYSGVIWGLAMTVITIIVSFVTFGFGLLLMWPINLFLSWWLVKTYNDKIDNRVLNGGA